jgi:trigger factor
MDLVARKDGEVVEGAEVSGMSYQVGKGGMLDGLDEALTGLSAGEQRTFTSQLVGGDLTGEDVEVEVKVESVKEQELPELDDDFAQTASEFDTLDELTEDVRTRLSRGKRLEQAAAARDAVLEKLLDLVDVPLPDGVVDSELSARRDQITQQLAMAGMTMEQYLDSEEQTVDEFEADLEKRVRDAVAAQFVLDQVAKQEEIGVNEGELQAHLMQRAQQSGQNPQEFIQHMLEHNHIPEMVSEVVRGKALATVVEAAVVTDASGHPVELKNLQPDGTIAEPGAEDDAAIEAGEDATDETTEAGDEKAETEPAEKTDA